MNISRRFEVVPVSEIKPNARNARVHSKEQVEELRRSMREFGFVVPILLDKDNNIIAGHGRYAAATAEGMDEVPCIYADHLTQTQLRAYMLADNRLAEHATWDMGLLDEELHFLDDMDFDISITGFDPFEDESAAVAEDDDYAVSLPTQPKTRLGDRLQLGKHTLMCGDSTDAESVERLMGGALADMFLTDPPYGVEYTGKTKDALTIENDSMEDATFTEFLRTAFENADRVMRDGAVFYVWHADSKAHVFRMACHMAGWTVRQVLIWVKNTLVLGRQDYQWKHEPCLYGWKEGAGHLWTGDRKQTTVLEYDRPTASKQHPTMKPIPLIGYQIKNNTNAGDAVLDTFGGSGTTLIACEQLDRRCYMMELDPRYCDVIIDRYEQLTGEKAVLLDG